MQASDQQRIRKLFDDYLKMYASRDDHLTAHFSDDFSGFTGGGDFLVKDRQEWVAITRQDFNQVKDPLRIELKDVAIQSLSDTVAVTTGFFIIHLPFNDHVLSRETARLVLIFRKETEGWKITHSSISIPYSLVEDGEVYPLKQLKEHNEALEQLVEERTAELFEANDHRHRTTQELEREVAERKQAGDALQRSNQKFEAVKSILPDGIGMLSLDGRLRLISEKLVEMHGYDVAEMDGQIGRSVFDFIDPSSHKALRENTQRVLAGDRDNGLSEYLALRKDGSKFYIDVNSTVLFDAAGNPESILYVERDISARKQAEAIKEEMEAQERQIQKAESLGRMAGAVAHNFNNILATVIGNLDLATVELSSGESPSASVAEALSASKKAAEMSHLMLTYLGQSLDKTEPLDLSAVCRRALPRLQATFPREVDLEIDLPDTGPVIVANANQVEEVITNLITNAAETIGEAEGVIRLMVTTVLAKDILAAHHFPSDWQPQNDTYACLEVTDTGSGIDAEDMEKLFDPFFSRKFTGRGMGLPVVLGVVRALSGVVTVQSEPGRGSAFRVFFPIV